MWKEFLTREHLVMGMNKLGLGGEGKVIVTFLQSYNQVLSFNKTGSVV
jgi:hypothetical protein